MMGNKRLYFIPIIAKALRSEDPKRAMKQAFDEIRELGKQAEYEEGFRQFLEFTKIAVMPFAEESGQKIQLVRDVIYRLIYALATDTFEGDETQKQTLISAFKSSTEWSAEYERIGKEAQAFQAPVTPIKVEVLRDDRIIGSSSISPDPLSISSISPGRYTVQFSNGRLLWEGELMKEDVIWAFAYPGKGLAMAAKTELQEQEPTRSISLLDGELNMHIFAGLETGQIRIESGKPS